MNESLEPLLLADSSKPEEVERADPRPRMPEPLPVNLVTVTDARLIAAYGLEKELDGFYVTLLGLEREESTEQLMYRAENFRIMFNLSELPLTRDGMRPLGIQILSLNQAEQKLIELQTQYLRQRSLTPGADALLLQDPAGNWIELVEAAMIR